MINYPEGFDWIPIYKELADKLLQYKDRRTDLIDILKDIFDNFEGFENPFREKKVDNEIHDTCPFTIFASFNKGQKDETRRNIIGKFKKKFDLKSSIPTSFSGIPNAMPLSM